jgi:hypothetical protein
VTVRPTDPLNDERLATRIDDLVWDEISGCDDPANLAPGWMLRKDRGGLSLSDAVSTVRTTLRAELAPVTAAIDALNGRLDRVEGR